MMIEDVRPESRLKTLVLILTTALFTQLAANTSLSFLVGALTVLAMWAFGLKAHRSASEMAIVMSLGFAAAGVTSFIQEMNSVFNPF